MLVVATLIAVTVLGAGPARAQVEGPWCAVYDIGPGSVAEKCDFMTFEACRQEISGGNRGFCNNNPRWAGVAPGQGASRARKRTRL
jgi:hypothetical protein